MTEISRINATPDLGRIVQAATDSLCDSMVDRLAVTAANAVEVVDKLNDEGIRDSLVWLLDQVGTMHRTGALGTVIDLVYFIHAARNSVSDSIVDRLFAFVEHMANNFATEDLATIAHEAKGSIEDALDHCNIPGGGGGLFGTVKMLSRPETQEAIQFLLAICCSLKKRVVVVSKSPVA